jgi:hypothetical protein
MASISLTPDLKKLQQNLEEWFCNLSKQRTQKEITRKDYFFQLSIRINVYQTYYQEIVPDEKILTSEQKKISSRIMNYLEMMKYILRIPSEQGMTPEEPTAKDITPMCPEFEFSQADLEHFAKMTQDESMFEQLEKSGPMMALSLVMKVLESNSEKKMSVSDFTYLVNEEKMKKKVTFLLNNDFNLGEEIEMVKAVQKYRGLYHLEIETPYPTTGKLDKEKNELYCFFSNPVDCYMFCLEIYPDIEF